MIVTARVRSTREGTVLTGVCLLTFGGGGGTYLLASGWEGVPTFPGLDGGGTYLGQGGGSTYHGQGGGYLPWLGWGGT